VSSRRPPWIAVDAMLDGSPKLAGLTSEDSATLVGNLVFLWGYCASHRTDGHIPASKWAGIGTRRGRRLAVEQGFAEPVADGYQMRNYQAWQATRATIKATSERNRANANRRWQAGPTRNATRNATRTDENDATRIRNDATRNATRNADIEQEVQARRGPVPYQRETDATRMPPGGPAGQPERASRPAAMRAGDRPPDAGRLCRRCGSDKHPTRDCPTGAHADPADPAGHAHHGAELARQALANRRRGDTPPAGTPF
jgi:hypothetical protein